MTTVNDLPMLPSLHRTSGNVAKVLNGQAVWQHNWNGYNSWHVVPSLSKSNILSLAMSELKPESEWISKNHENDTLYVAEDGLYVTLVAIHGYDFSGIRTRVRVYTTRPGTIVDVPGDDESSDASYFSPALNEYEALAPALAFIQSHGTDWQGITIDEQSIETVIHEDEVAFCKATGLTYGDFGLAKVVLGDGNKFFDIMRSGAYAVLGKDTRGVVPLRFGAMAIAHRNTIHGSYIWLPHARAAMQASLDGLHVAHIGFGVIHAYKQLSPGTLQS